MSWGFRIDGDSCPQQDHMWKEDEVHRLPQPTRSAPGDVWKRAVLLTCGSAGKESACNAGDLGLIPGLGRFPGEGKGYPLQYS